MITDNQNLAGQESGAGYWSGRYFSAEDMACIRSLIASDPQASRTRISVRVCEALNWRRADGRLKDMRARVVLLRMHEKGYITLPALQGRSGNQTRLLRRKQRQQQDSKQLELHLDQNRPALRARVDQLGPLQIERVDAKRRQLSKEWNSLMERYHYLGYVPVVGQQIRYYLKIGNEPVALASFGSAAWKVAARDGWIGWSAQQRQLRLGHVVNNTRFLILPWVRSANLASTVLSRLAKQLTGDWRELYGMEPWLLETFVDKERFRGTCYRAANWQCVGQTQGRGKNDRYHRDAVPIKEVLVYPLRPRVCELLSADTVDS